MAAASSVFFPENWEVYSYESGADLVVVTFYVGADRIPRQQFPRGIRVVVAIRRANANGAPALYEAERLWRVEDELTRLLDQHRVPCILVARLTRGRRRELAFQVADCQAFFAAAQPWLDCNADEWIESGTDDGWKFFDEDIWPDQDAWTLIHDRRAVDRLLEAGGDRERSHSLEYSFHGEADKLATVCHMLAGHGYEPRPVVASTRVAPTGDVPGFASPDDSAPAPTLRAVAVALPLNLDRIHAESLRVRRLCDQLGVQYLGWNAQAVPAD